MPVVESSTTVPVDVDTAFAVAQTTGQTRLRWDPFIRHQHFLDGATEPGRGVRTSTHHRSGLRMVSEYVSFRPPTHTGMRMVSGPWFFGVFAAGWRFSPTPEGTTVATWRYNFRCRPRLLSPALDRIGTLVLGRDIERRIAGFARGCADPIVVEEAQRDHDRRSGQGP